MLFVMFMWGSVEIYSWGKYNLNIFVIKYFIREYYRYNRSIEIMEINCNKKYCGWYYGRGGIWVGFERWVDCGVYEEGKGIIGNNRFRNV